MWVTSHTKYYLRNESYELHKNCFDIRLKVYSISMATQARNLGGRLPNPFLKIDKGAQVLGKKT